MTRRRCRDCQDGRHCRHTGYVPAGAILALCRCLDCDPKPIQARLFSHALVENTLGPCADCGHQATKLLVGGAGQPDTSLCAACEHRRYLAATGGRDLANEERARWGQPPIPRPDPGRRARRFRSRHLMLGRFVARNDTETPAGHPGRRP